MTLGRNLETRLSPKHSAMVTTHWNHVTNKGAFNCKTKNNFIKQEDFVDLFEVMLYIHGKQRRSCQGGQLLNHTICFYYFNF